MVFIVFLFVEADCFKHRIKMFIHSYNWDQFAVVFFFRIGKQKKNQRRRTAFGEDLGELGSGSSLYADVLTATEHSIISK